MEDEVVGTISSLGGSLPVENVQELAVNNLKEIPPQYIRPEEVELDKVSVNESSQVPVIDLSKLARNQSSRDEELARLHQACKDWGFFQLINHGSSEAIEKMKVVTEEFFKLPLEEKMAYAQQPSTGFEGYGHAFVVSKDQKLDWGDLLALTTRPLSERKIKFWPTTPFAFRESLDNFSSELQSVFIRLLRSMAENLGVNTNTLTALFEDESQILRMNYYPPCQEADKVIGIAPHSDGSGLTLLVQVNHVHGLQLKKNDKWIPIDPLPDAIIVNIGDLMEIISNGEYRSIEHRAMVNPEKERLSIAAFHGPNIKAMVGPHPDLVKDKGAKLKTIRHEDFLTLYFGRKLDGKRQLDNMRITQ